ncbi:coatomer subunit zeta-3 [Blastocystis sp. subtype 4]|uniref:coatomer subunit zeta-3 n=1 Tax=Blastocystis sp. subtype 4 TaxID=944170 RepID=UPI000711E715|nr:coatomer subunit zeta-3 [Blastocystis sp. subtype 4]KNB44545.1 coatomer subunit zeta-3 [Blastocystis sp. subtype 4]|eukprot:XP_014527988.1 coatomer subunit zeta-3 [Blastocystis sp. subtype 4]
MPYLDNYKVVRGILILDEEGNAIVKKYYTNDFPTAESQTAFEQQVFKKFKPGNSKEDTSIGILDRYVVVGKGGNDCSIFFYGSENENEMILISAMDGFFEALKLLLKDKLERNEILKKMPSMFLLMDELCDAGFCIVNWL